MSNSTIWSLNFASQQVTIYVGSLLLVAGLIGNPLTLLVFLSLHTFRQSSCAFYLTIMSFVNFLHLFTGLFTLIMINGFVINWLNVSLFYCKFRSFYIPLSILTSLSCMCLATIDQFLATCSRPRWHQWNNIRLARYLLLGLVIIWIIHGIPFLFLYNHIESPVTQTINCAITNSVFQKYYDTFYLLIIIGIIPLMTMIIFGLLAYRNLQQIAYRTVPLVRRELDKQLTTMVLVQVFYDVIAITPTVMLRIFNAIYDNPTDPLFVVLLTFIQNLTIIIYYFYFVGSFYIYVCVSKRFRQQLIYVLLKIHLIRFHPRRINNNQIEPHT